MATPTIDFHTHVFPDRVAEWLGRSTVGAAAVSALDRLRIVRQSARLVLRPLMGSVHSAHTVLRYLPEVARKPIDEVLGAVAPLPGLLLESGPDDLSEALEEAGVAMAVLVAHPPYATNEYVLDLVRGNPEHFVAAVTLPASTPSAVECLIRYVREGGARVLKLSPAADGVDPSDPVYAELLRAANELRTPVIIHTGSFHSHLYFKTPEYGEVERFESWFADFPEIDFVLAHMNLHEPGKALDLAERYPRVHVGTSWQPAEVIGEAVRRLGGERVLFASDWPVVGNNFGVALRRVDDCVESGWLTREDAARVLGGNAQRLLRIETDAE